MSSQQSETLITTHTVILAGPNDWDQWIGVVKYRADGESVWEYIDPDVKKNDLPRHRAPSEPSPSVVNPQKTTFSALDEGEKEELRALRKQYDRAYKRYEKEEAALKSLRTYIISTISRDYIDYTFEGNTVYDVLVSLKQAVAPTDDARKVDLATQYLKMKKAPKSQNIEKWLREWEKVYNDCKKVKLPEVDGDRPVKDFVYAVESASSGWSEYWKNKLQNLKRKKESLPTLRVIIEVYRNHRRLESAQNARSQDGSYAASFKKKPINKFKSDAKLEKEEKKD